VTLSLVVSLGTDHHEFTRVVTWIENWVTAQDGAVDVFLQHGSTRPSPLAENAVIVPRDQLLDRYRGADMIVSQVGPGTILDANSVGRKPIVIPRNPDFGEHVDGHQILFGRFMAESGAAFIAEDEDELHAVMDRLRDEPALTRMTPRSSPADATAARLGEVVDAVLSRPVGFLRWRRLGILFRR
jgi:UDP-N-acetylglucosamine transferase subunit ALG13